LVEKVRDPRLLERVALELCTDVEAQLQNRQAPELSERAARAELVACILGSQVSNASAGAWTRALADEGLLDDYWWTIGASAAFSRRVLNVLSGTRASARRLGRHRFFRVRAMQIAASRDVLVDTPLLNRLKYRDPWQCRRELVSDLPGLGPKQASMLLRNLQFTLDLAILDRHIVRYMALLGLLSTGLVRVSPLTAYEATEGSFVEYATTNGVKPGILDWAVWITMKAASERQT